MNRTYANNAVHSVLSTITANGMTEHQGWHLTTNHDFYGSQYAETTAPWPTLVHNNDDGSIDVIDLLPEGSAIVVQLNQLDKDGECDVTQGLATKPLELQARIMEAMLNQL